MQKSKRSLYHGQFGLLRDAPILAASAQFFIKTTKIKFFAKKTSFFDQSKNHITRPIPPPQGPSNVGTFYASFDMVLLLLQFTHILILWSWYILLWLQARPERLFWQIFWKVFGPARVRISYRALLRRVFFCNVKKVCAKAPIKYEGCGLLRDPILQGLLVRIRDKKNKN